ncbi:MAG: hypothetical protein FWD45_02470 [Coriobacteriia bacterium]|nr:hypothetical protein [Coriobacteriia bacterium]
MEDSIVLVLPDKTRINGWAVITPAEIVIYKSSHMILSAILSIVFICIIVVISTIYLWFPGGAVGGGLFGGMASILAYSINRAIQTNATKKGKVRQELFRIQVGAIASAGKESYMLLNRNALGITMFDGAHFVCIFGRPRKANNYLMSLIPRPWQ